MRIGYARVSTLDQNLDLQLHALKLSGCEKKIFEEKVSAASKERPQLIKLFSILKGDSVVV